MITVLTGPDAALFVVLALVGVILSAMYSGLEIGVYTLNRIRLTLRTARGEPAARRLRAETRNMTRALTVLLIGTNAANYLASYGLAELMHGFGLSEWTLIGVEVLLITPLIFVFGETLPKELFRTHTDHWSYALARMLTISRWIMTVTLILPIVHAFVFVATRLFGQDESASVTARERISHLLKEGVGAGLLTMSQTTVADRALVLGDRRVIDVAIPWSRVATIAADATPDDRRRRLLQRPFTRLPVVDRRGRVTGVLSSLDAALDPDRPTPDLAAAPLVFDPDTRLIRAITIMRRERRRLAIVQRPNAARPVGIVTLKDLVEPLTGKLAAW